MGEHSKCKGPEVGKKLVHTRARKKPLWPQPIRKEKMVQNEAGEIEVVQKMLCLVSKEFDVILRAIGSTEKFGARAKRI